MQRVSQVDMLNFSSIVETERVTEKNITDGKAMTEIINNISSESGLDSVKDPLNSHKAASNEANLVHEIPNIINDENIIIVSGQGKTTYSVLTDRLIEVQTFPYLSPKGRHGYISSEYISIVPAHYFN